MSDKNSVYPKVESRFVFKTHMFDVYVEAFNHQVFHLDRTESAISKKYILQ